MTLAIIRQRKANPMKSNGNEVVFDLPSVPSKHNLWPDPRKANRMIRHTAPMLLSLAFLPVGTGGCGRKPAAVEEVSQASPPTAKSVGWPSSNAVPADRLEWNRRTLVNAYNEAGVRDPRWDADAGEALEAFARVRSGNDTNASARLTAALKRASDAACSDPLVRYLNLRFAYGNASDANAAGADAYREAGDALMYSGYPDIRKFYGAIRAAQAWKSAHGSSTNATRAMSHFRRGAFFHLEPVLRAPDTPFREAYEAADELRRAIFSNSKQEDDILPVLVECFQTRWPQEARALTLCGRAYVRLAWNRRGAGYADSVTDQGWKDFARYLADAERCLERSWELDSTIADTADAMIEVELGQGRGRDRMELWFGRAMAVDPACYDAAYSKAWYLQPKWHGSAEHAISFGRECVESKEWKGRVPLMLWQVHRMLANDNASGLKDAHWKQPGVWEDVRDSFERFFELNPGAISWRHDYAFHAYKCGQFGKFLDLLPQMGWVNHRYFGGEKRFAEIVAEAEKKTGRKATLSEK